MMDQPTTSAAEVPGWFWLAAGLALLFEGAGCFSYLAQVGTARDSLPLEQRAIWDATPTWMTAAYAIAVWVGLVGAVTLLLRRKLAVVLLLVSLLAVLVQFSGLLLVERLREMVPESALMAPVMIIVGGYLVFMLARLAWKRGWLR